MKKKLSDLCSVTPFVAMGYCMTVTKFDKLSQDALKRQEMKRKIWEAKAVSRKAKSTLKKLSGKVLRCKKFRERATKGESLCLAVQYFGSGSFL